MIQILLVSLLLFTSLDAKSISIAVAANVSYAIKDIKKEFNSIYPDIKVQTTLGSSGKLTAQISHGAPYDLFMSANMKYPEALFKSNIAISRPKVYAKGSLAILSIKPRDFSQKIDIVKNPNIKRVAIANPKTAPYGIAAFEALKNADLVESIKSKFIYGESISQTLSYTITAADLGFVAKSLLYTPKMKIYKENINWIEVDEKLYTPTSQGVVILRHGEKNPKVTAFYKFLSTKKAQNIFTKFGYKLP